MTWEAAAYAYKVFDFYAAQRLTARVTTFMAEMFGMVLPDERK